MPCGETLIPDCGGVELGGEDIEDAVGGRDGHLANHRQTNQQTTKVLTNDILRWKCNLRPFKEIETDRPTTIQQKDMRIHKEVTLLQNLIWTNPTYCFAKEYLLYWFPKKDARFLELKNS